MQTPDSFLVNPISNKRSLLILTVLLGCLVPGLYLMAQPFLTSFVLAAILAIAVQPIYQRLKLATGKPGLATAITAFGSMGLLSLIVVLVGMAFFGELRSTYQALNQKSFEEGGWPALVSHTTDRLVDALSGRVHIDKEQIREEFIERLKAASAYLLNNFGDFAGGVTSAIFTVFVVTFFLYFLLRYGDEWLAKLERHSPLDSASTRRLMESVRSSIAAGVNGVLAVAVAQGAALSVGFWICDVRSAVLWGVIGGFASIVPVLGSPLVWIPIVIAYAFMGAWWKVIFLAVWGGLVVGSIDNVLRPFVVGAGSNLHPALMAFAALGGTYAFGALGILLGPLVVSLAGTVIAEIQTAREQEQVVLYSGVGGASPPGAADHIL